MRVFFIEKMCYIYNPFTDNYFLVWGTMMLSVAFLNKFDFRDLVFLKHFLRNFILVTNDPIKYARLAVYIHDLQGEVMLSLDRG